MTSIRRLRHVVVVLTVIVIAAALRARAVDRLPIDYDEDDYLLAGQHYARALLAGDWAEITNWDYNYEHPPLSKLLYGAAIAPLPPAPELPDLPTSAPPAKTLPRAQFYVARLVSAALGWLEVLALTVFNPLAGFLLAIHTWQIKYTDQIMLEALPALTSLLAVLWYLHAGVGVPTSAGGAQKSRWPNPAWLALSAVALGLTAAGKYLYCVAGIAIVAHWLWKTYPAGSAARRDPRALARWLAPVAVWGLAAVVVFVAADPYLWPDPLGRLLRSLRYHEAYATSSAEVERYSYPTWQPFVWLAGPARERPGVFLVSLDLLITLLALSGLRRLWRRQPVFVLWLAIALAFLLVWPTKWPQYILVLTAPLSLAAAEGFAQHIWEPLSLRWELLRAPKPAWTRAASAPARRTHWGDLRRAAPWLLPGLLLLVPIIVFPFIYQAAMSLTDFNALSIRDGLNGGVWREVWKGLTGQVHAVVVDPYSQPSQSVRLVRWAGPGLLWQLFSGGLSEVLVFNTLWAALAVALQTALGVAAALLLNRPGIRGARWWRAILILPWAIPEFVGALIWLQMVADDHGLIRLLAPASVRLPSFAQDQNYALAMLLVAATWAGFPLIMLAATAGLKLIPPDSYDAAALDGASGWKLFRYVTWPLLLPLLAPAIIIRSIFAFNQFYLLWMTQPPWPITSFATLSYLAFSQYGGSQYGVSAAINIFTVVVLMLLILWFSRQSRAGEGVTYA